MVKAVDASLKVLGADHLQAVIVCHRDQKHPHVHVIVNRVDPTTGKMYGFSNDRHQLDAWSHAYEEGRGRIVTPNRDQKFKERAQARPAERPREVTPQQERPKSKAADLAQLGAAQKVRHAQEWKDLTAQAAAQRETAWAARPNLKVMATQHRAETRPQWSEFGKMMAAERRAFEKREREFFGRIVNALAVVASRPIRGDGTDRGILSATFAAVLDSSARRDTFDRSAAAKKAAFARPLNQALDAKIAAAKREHAAKLTAARQSFDTARAALIARQDLERRKIREAWKQIYLERERAVPSNARQTPQNFRHRRRLDRGADATARSTPIDTPQQENPAMRREFDKARELAPANHAPIPDRQISTPIPTPEPSPSGTPPPPKNKLQNVPDVDKVQEWARTQDAQRSTSQEARKAAPDSLRAVTPAAYRPPPITPPAPAKETPAKEPPSRDYWNKAAEAPKPQEPVKARDYWDRTAKPEKPTPTHDRSKDRDFDRDR